MNNLQQAWLVILLAIIFAAALAAVDGGLQERIRDNKLRETLQQIPELVPESTDSEEYTGLSGTKLYRAFTTEGTVGWVVQTKGLGFADVIEILIGLNADASSITGVYVLEQKETPGLGDFITESSFRSQFIEKAQGVSAVKGGAASGNQINALTGATISSDSMCRIINNCLTSELCTHLKQAAQIHSKQEGVTNE